MSRNLFASSIVQNDYSQVRVGGEERVSADVILAEERVHRIQVIGFRHRTTWSQFEFVLQVAVMELDQFQVVTTGVVLSLRIE